MMTPEKKVKAKVVAILKEFGAYYFYASTGGYGASGVPDIVGCYHGNFFAVECKAGKGKTTALQEKNIANIYAAGGTALVVNEDNIEDVRGVLISMDSVEINKVLEGAFK
jgi:Holliday junction resolvase